MVAKKYTNKITRPRTIQTGFMKLRLNSNICLYCKQNILAFLGVDIDFILPEIS